jgi:hypothetical protein
MTEIRRPARVVVVDADNPLEEIHGEFFWREDHERIVAAEREAAFNEGFRLGLSRSRVFLQHRRSWARRRGLRGLVVRALAVLVIAAFVVSLATNLLADIHKR